MLGCKGWNEGESFEPVTNKFLVVTRAMSFRAWMVEFYLLSVVVAVDLSKAFDSDFDCVPLSENTSQKIKESKLV